MNVLIGSQTPLTETEMITTLMQQGEPVFHIDSVEVENSVDWWCQSDTANTALTLLMERGWDMGKKLDIWSSAFSNGGAYLPGLGVFYRTHQGGHYHGVLTSLWEDQDQNLAVFGEDGLRHARRMIAEGLTVRFWMGRSASNIVGGQGDGGGGAQAEVIRKAQSEGVAFALQSSLFPESSWITEKDEWKAQAFLSTHAVPGERDWLTVS